MFREQRILNLLLKYYINHNAWRIIIIYNLGFQVE